MLNKIKKFLLEQYVDKGYDIGIYLLKNMGISVLCIVILNVLTGTELTFTGFLEWVIALPIISLVVLLARFAVKAVNTIIPLPPGIVKIALDFIAIGVVLTFIGFMFPKDLLPDENWIQIGIALIFDFAYVFCLIWLLESRKNDAIHEEQYTDNE